MKKSKKIKLITLLSAVASAFGIGAATKSNVNNALTASTVDITTLSWVIRNVYNTNNTTEIKSIVEEDNKTLFAKFRNLKTAASIAVTFNISQSQPIQIVISADTAPYTGSKTWKASYRTPEPTPTPTPTPVPGIVSILYSELAELKNDENLPAGQQYRIADYAATVDSSLTNAMSATKQYPFDIIINAESENSFNENVLVQARSDASYTTKANFSAWTCKYSFDNDSSRFDWATTNGKGVIYYLQDEFGNEAPYDFKNIQFKPNDDSAYYYTFDKGDGSEDYSLKGDTYNVYGNVIKNAKVNGGVSVLNQIVFKGEECYNNTFANDCNNNTFGSICYGNTFATGCNNIKAANGYLINNTFNNDCGHINLSCSNSQQYTNNTFGNGTVYVDVTASVFMYNTVMYTAGSSTSVKTLSTACSGKLIVDGEPIN